jgi:UDP-glucose 4-epimerase
VRALDYLLEGGPSTVLNLGTGHGYSVQEVIGTISETAGRSVPTVAADRRAGDPPCLVASAERARRVLGDGLTARSDLQSIISTALQWHQSDFYRRQLESRQR